MSRSADLPPPAKEHLRLPETINAVTRAAHSKLNKLIIARVPLAIPPRAADPSTYAAGLLHIASIYVTFESLWQNILDCPPLSSTHEGRANSCPEENPKLAPRSNSVVTNDEEPDPPTVFERLRSVLSRLYLPGLMRSNRLRADLGHLTGWPDHVVEEQLRAVGQTGRLAEFLAHMKRGVQNRPHVLLAYAYILFMALFAGGRFIRASLESAGDTFWVHVPSNVPSPVPKDMLRCQRTKQTKRTAMGGQPSDDGAPTLSPRIVNTTTTYTEPISDTHAKHATPLQFFHFPTPADGEDLKKEFKRRFSESEELLTVNEWDDIVCEAICIFDNMLLLVAQLDAVCGTFDVDGNGVATGPPAIFTDLPVSGRVRDSFLVTKERSARAASMKKHEGAGEEGGEETGSAEPSRRLRRSAGSVCDVSAINKDSTPACPASEATKEDAVDCVLERSKSMRFEKDLPVPDRGDVHAKRDLPHTDSCFKLTNPQSGFVQNFLPLVGFAALFAVYLFARQLTREPCPRGL
jgi:hypothetical protein